MICPDCKGEGTLNGKSCPECHGVGEIPGPDDTPEEQEDLEEAIDWNKSFGL